MRDKILQIILFASLVAAMVFPFSVGNVFADKSEETSDSFEIKTQFNDKNEVREYGKELGKELKRVYKESKSTGNIQEFENLKTHGVQLINQYDPTATPLLIIEDEYFDMKQINNPKVSSVRYESPQEATISNVMHVSGSIKARIGYDASCNLIPIYVCEYQQTSWRTVSTEDSGRNFGIWVNDNRSWLAPFTKMKAYSGGNYDGYSVYRVFEFYSQETVDWNFNGPQIFGVKSTGPIAGSCSCESVPEGTYIQTLVVLNWVH